MSCLEFVADTSLQEALFADTKLCKATELTAKLGTNE